MYNDTVQPCVCMSLGTTQRHQLQLLFNINMCMCENYECLKIKNYKKLL